MRSLDSPVLKPPLIRFSSARLIGTVATSKADEGQDAAFPDKSPVPEAFVPGAVGSPIDLPGDSPVDSPAGPPAPRRINSEAVVIEDDGLRQARERAASRLRRIEGQIAYAETRLAEAQELFEKLEREANMARVQAEEARQQAAAIREAAHQEGYRAGVERAEHDMAGRLSAVATLAEGAVGARAEFLRRCEPEVIELVFEIARKVIGEHLALNKEAIAEVARRALSIAGQAELYYLHLHPDDAELVEKHLCRDTLGMPLQVVPDERLNSGDCLVRTAYGRVDAGVEAQLREIRGQMMGVA